jgi:hypothetical protein
MRRVLFSADHGPAQVGPLTVKPTFVNGVLASVLICIGDDALVGIIAPAVPRVIPPAWFPALRQGRPELVVFVEDDPC